jgi:hypothetical protein
MSAVSYWKCPFRTGEADSNSVVYALHKEENYADPLGIFVMAVLAGIAIADTNVTGKWTGSFNILEQLSRTESERCIKARPKTHPKACRL